MRHDDRVVVVEPAPRGRQPTWGGFLPQFLGFEVCQHILRRAAQRRARIRYLDDAAAAVLAERRDAMREVVDSPRGGVEVDDGEIRWWTFAGGRINATLRYALEAVGGDWKVVPDNFLIKVRGEHLDHRALPGSARAARANPSSGRTNASGPTSPTSLPNYRLSKFQPLMPPWVEREVVAGYLLDVGGAWRWLSGREASRPRVPDGVRNLTPKDAERAAELKRTSPAELPLLRRDNNQPVIWVRTVPQLEEAVAKLMSEPVVGLDTECTLTSRTLCLIQMASREATYLIDALEFADLEPLSRILASTETTKLVHYAPFEREILSRHGLRLDAVRDTRDVSRRLRPDVKGHSLREVCAREFGLELDKREQVSDWSRRPLTENQLTYAALDAEVLLRLHTHFEDVAQSPATLS